MYVTKTIEYTPKAKDLAQKIEELSNQMDEEGYELVTFSVTCSAKAVVVFKSSKDN